MVCVCVFTACACGHHLMHLCEVCAWEVVLELPCTIPDVHSPGAPSNHTIGYVYTFLCVVGGAPNYYPNSFSGPLDSAAKVGAPPGPVDQVYFIYTTLLFDIEVTIT